MRNSRAIFSLLAVLLLTAGMRLYGITGESAWGDEVLTLRHLPAPSFSAYWEGVFGDDPRLRISPAYYAIQYPWSIVAGGGLTSMRLLSVLLSVACAGMVWHMGRAIGGNRAGFFAGLLFALAPVQVYYGQEVRFYALMCLAALVSFEGLRQVRVAPARPRGWMLNLLGNVLLVWTHAFTLLVLVAQGLFILMMWPRRPRWWLGWGALQAGVVAAFAIWLGFLNYDFAGSSTAFNDSPPTWRELAMTGVVFAGGRFSNEHPGAYLPFQLSLDMIVVAWLTGLVGWALYRGMRGNGAARGDTIMLLLWFVLPVLLLFVAALAWRPVFFYRYMLYAALPLYLLAARGLVQIARPTLRNAILAVGVACLAWQSLALARPLRPDYQAMARAVEGDRSQAKRVLALKAFNGLGVEYALRDTGVPVETHHGFREFGEAAYDYATRGETVWAVFHRWSRTDEFARYLADSCVVMRVPAGGIPPLTVFRVACGGSPADVAAFRKELARIAQPNCVYQDATAKMRATFGELKPYVSTFEELLQDPATDVSTRRFSAWLLSEAGAVDALIAFAMMPLVGLPDGADLRACLAAIEFTGRTRDPGARTWLMQALARSYWDEGLPAGDGREEVIADLRDAALRGLAWFRDPEVVGEVKALAETVLADFPPRALEGALLNLEQMAGLRDVPDGGMEMP